MESDFGIFINRQAAQIDPLSESKAVIRQCQNDNDILEIYKTIVLLNKRREHNDQIAR